MTINDLKKRLKEKSTYFGLATLLGLIGIHYSPDQYQAIGLAILSVIAAVEIFREEKQ